jgi:predicted RNA-binding protein with TRAM domain
LGDSTGQHGSDGILHVESGYAPFVPDALLPAEPVPVLAGLT